MGAVRVRPLLVAGALLLSACSQAGQTAEPLPVATAAGSTGIAAEASPSPASRLQGTFAAVPVRRYIKMWNAPGTGSSDFTFDAHDPFGQVSPLLVDGARADASGRTWYRLLLPIRPNGSQAWVRADEVRLVRRSQRIVVDLSQRTLRRFVDGKLVDRFSVGVGMPQFPTAKGTFYVWIKVPFADPSGPYGIYALGLSGFSPVLSDWPGGGRMAIHGTSDPADRGQQVSHGCIRVYNEQMAKLRDVPLGTPVIIRA